jgi:crossover junction endodeoxyribonuclease RuvC
VRIIGIDPGYAIVGFGVVMKDGEKYSLIDYGTITTPAHTDMSERLKIIYDELNFLIKKYKPEVCGMEDLYFAANTKTAIKVGQARGVAILAMKNAGLDIFSYTPLQVKQALVGYGQADKDQVAKMVMSMLGLEKKPTPDDAADALAIAITHGNSSRLSNIMNLYNGRS